MPPISRAWSIAILLFVAALTIPPAAMKPLTHDEIYTHQVARQPSLAAVWTALENGADNHPPLDYWARHLSMMAFGDNPLACRLPGLIYICVASVLLFQLISRHLPPVYGVSAAILVLLVCGFQDAIFARGYALLVAECIAALYCWDSLATDRTSRLHWSLFALALVAACYTHYYGVLFVVAFGIAAFVQSLLERRFLLGTFGLLAATAMAGLPLLPLMRTASRFRTNFYTPVTLEIGMDVYAVLLGPALPALIVTVLFAILAASWKKENDPPQTVARTLLGLPFATTLALTSFSCLPIVAFALARYTGAFRARYVEAAGIAICIIAVVSLAAIADTVPIRRRAAILVGIPMLFLAITVMREVRGIAFFNRFNSERSQQLARIERAAGVPLVLAEEGVFLETTYNYPDVLRNTYYLYQPLGEERMISIDRAIIGLKTIMPLRSISYDSFIAEHDSYFFVGLWQDPVLERAFADRAAIEYHPATKNDLAYWIVHLRNASTAPSGTGLQ